MDIFTQLIFQGARCSQSNERHIVQELCSPDSVAQSLKVSMLSDKWKGVFAIRPKRSMWHFHKKWKMVKTMVKAKVRVRVTVRVRVRVRVNVRSRVRVRARVIVTVRVRVRIRLRVRARVWVRA